MGKIVEKNISVLDFVAEYNKCGNKALREDFIRHKLNVNTYVAVIMKKVMADKIIAMSCHDGNGAVKVDSFKRYILETYALINSYTNLVVDEKSWMEQYTALDEAGLISIILGKIPEKEVESFHTIVKMAYDDMMTNEYEIHAFVMNVISKLLPVTEKSAETIVQAFIKNAQGKLKK